MAEIIENPVINSPYQEPSRHFVFADEGITSQIAEGRRPSSYFIPIPPPKKRLKGEDGSGGLAGQGASPDALFSGPG